MKKNNEMQRRILVSLFSLLLSTWSALGQSDNFETPKQYTVADISIEGVKFLQPAAIINLTGIKKGSKVTIPGPEVSNAIEKLWNHGLFSDVQVYASKIVADSIYIKIFLRERPRLNNLMIEGVKDGEKDDIKEDIKLSRGSQVTDNALQNAKQTIKKHYLEKGFYNVDLEIIQKPDTSLNGNYVNVTFIVTKNRKIKIEHITFHGNESLKSRKLHSAMKDTKEKHWYRIFKRSKYIPQKFTDDKKNLVTKYKQKGFRDIEITRDTVYPSSPKTVDVEITVKEGRKYYFRNITFLGNTKYGSELLSNILGIKKGEVYNEEFLSDKIYGMEGISSVYLDNGYLFFNADPVEKSIQNDSIDVEIRIFEGRQARINRIIFTGNTKTKDKVVLREIRTLPGELFSRADIIRTQRELAQMGYFDPEKMNIDPKPHPEDGTVDIVYNLEEKSSDQIELSGGWSGKYVVLSGKLHLNDLSLHDLFTKGEWPPFGDGQSLILNYTINPQYYTLQSITFTEPWLGGKKPNSLTVSAFRSVRRNTTTGGRMRVAGGSAGLGRRLKWPDDYFTLYNELSYQNYKLRNYELIEDIDSLNSHNFAFTTNFGRNSIDQPLYPRSGSSLTIGLELTPPYSAFRNGNPDSMTVQEKYKWIEYHKWTFKTETYITLVDKLVLQSKLQFGFLGYFNKKFRSPFEGFDMGGDGLSNINLYGMDNIPLRGYTSSSVTPSGGGNIYDKMTVELRYPLTTSQSATIYGLVFAEAGNCWTEYYQFNPFNVKRSAGMGIRIYLPMMGLLGFDYGYGFDEISTDASANGWQPHFVLGQQL